jgi:hypothetical protein
MLLLLLTGVFFTALSAAFSYGPDHAWAWLDVPALTGLIAAALLMLLTLWLPSRAASVLALLALAVQLTLLNQAPDSPYLSHTLQIWEQGRFIRFNGLAQWLGWLWPFAALGYVLLRVSQTEDHEATSEDETVKSADDPRSPSA